jgi:hypothetical protein
MSMMTVSKHMQTGVNKHRIHDSYDHLWILTMHLPAMEAGIAKRKLLIMFSSSFRPHLVRLNPRCMLSSQRPSVNVSPQMVGQG